MTVAIIQYNAGNTCSVRFALERLGTETIISSDPETIRSADKVILPGVGAAGAAMEHLRQTGLDQLIVSLQQPVLGICLGMQLLCAHSEEGDVPCLGLTGARVQKFSGKDKIPHIGWNRITGLQSPLFRGVEEGSYMYFVHAYFVPHGTGTIAATDYILPYSSAIREKNFYGVQFHPEKSGDCGQTVLSNFLNL